jgi:hypothetical protein
VSQSRLARLAPLSGVLFVGLLIASFIVGGEVPDSDAPTDEVVSFWIDNDDANIISALLGALAAVSLTWFGGSVRVALRRAEGDPGRLAALAFGGFLFAAVGGSIFSGLQFSAAETAGEVPDEVTQTLSVLNSDMFATFIVGVIIAFLASAVTILRFGGLPRWLGYVAILIAVLGVTPAGFGAFIAAGVWILVVSVLLYQQQGADAAA